MRNRTFLIVALMATMLVACGGSSQPAEDAPKASGRVLQGGVQRGGVQDTSIVPIKGYRAGYLVVRDPQTGLVTVTSKRDAGDVSTYGGVQLLKFYDIWTSFDIEGPAGQVYRLYQAAFNRKPDGAGLGFWIKANENGRTIPDIAGDFVTSTEFRTLYGTKPTNRTVVNAFYRNVLHRDGETTGVDWWIGQMNDGASVEGVLQGFADSAENRTNLAAAMQNGFDYEPYQPAGALVPKPTSYANAKLAYRTPVTLPAEEMWAAAYARADFKGDGSTTLFSAHRTYDNTKPLAQATAGVMGFWSTAADGGWVREPGMIDTTVSCIEPRKAVVADFNGDGKPDVLLACTGYDNAPFPGERLMMIESTPSGVFHAHVVDDFAGFFHGAAAADLDGDGLIDFIATDNDPARPLRMFRNSGNGHFREVFNAFPASTARGGYFTLELVDVNHDGKLDVLLGGHEFEGTPTTLLYGDGSPTFANATARILPATDATAGVVLDFVSSGSTLYVGRTNGGASGFYTKLALQTIDLASFSTTSLVRRDGPLFIWLIADSQGGVISDRTDRPLGL